MNDNIRSLLMMFIVAGLIVVPLMLLTGCGKVDRSIAAWTGNPVSVCYKGVEYVQFTSGASVAYNQDGTVKNCVE